MLLTHHPAWRHDRTGRYYRAVTVDGTPGMITVVDPPGGDSITGGSVRRYSVQRTKATDTLGGDAALTLALQVFGSVTSVVAPDLWDALAAAIARRDWPAEKTTDWWEHLCTGYGEQVTHAGLTAWTFPGPRTVLELPTGTTCGQSYIPLNPLEEAAEAFLHHDWPDADAIDSDRWPDLDRFGVDDLYRQMRDVPAIGATTARAALATYTGDYRHYPPDTAFLTHVHTLSPHRWPDTLTEFAAAWRTETGEHRSTWTTLVLAAMSTTGPHILTT